MRILLIEDELNLSNILQKGLKKLGFAVDAVFDGEEAIYCIESNSYDLIILDINIPKIDGFGVLKNIRENSNNDKVIILSAKNQIEDKIYGFELGANDFLEKPFDFLELVARIKNLLRWDFLTRDNTLSYKDLTINYYTGLVAKDNIEIPLTNKEFGILEYLSQNNDRYIPAEKIIEHVWDSEVDLFSNSFKFHISSLKKKLNTDNAIVNIRGKGYKFGGHIFEKPKS